MGYPRFGFSVDNKKAIDEIYAIKKSVDSITAKMLLREAYEIDYNVFDHDRDTTRPLALVAMHPKENASEHSELYNTIRRFELYGVGAKFNVTLAEFLSLPREITTLILDICGDRVTKENAEVNTTLNEVQRQARDQKKGRK